MWIILHYIATDYVMCRNLHSGLNLMYIAYAYVAYAAFICENVHYYRKTNKMMTLFINLKTKLIDFFILTFMDFLNFSYFLSYYFLAFIFTY